MKLNQTDRNKSQKYLSLLILIALTIFHLENSAQDILIYHGMGDMTTFINTNSKKEYMKNGFDGINKKGSIIEVKVVNPNPLFYTYEFKTENFTINDNLPDLKELIGLIQPLLGNIKEMTKYTEKYSFAANDTQLLEKLKDYETILDSLHKDIASAKNFISGSDIPESKEDAIKGLSTGGLRYAQAQIAKLPSEPCRFNSPELLKELNDNAEKLKEISSNNDVDFIIRLIKNYNEQIVQSIETIKDKINIKSILVYTFTMDDKPTKITLIIKRKDKNTGARDTLESVIMTLKPRYERPDLELVPVANLTYASGVPKFGITNGIVTKSDDNGFNYSIGTSLIYNFSKFGEYKEGEFGIGIGYNLLDKNSNKNLNSFYLSSLLSYRQFFKIGIGVGYFNYPSHLKEGVNVGEGLPAEIKNIDEVVETDKRLAGFISFSFTGLKLK